MRTDKPVYIHAKILLEETAGLTNTQVGGLIRLLIHQVHNGGFNSEEEMLSIAGMEQKDLDVLMKHPFFRPASENITARFLFRGVTKEAYK